MPAINGPVIIDFETATIDDLGNTKASIEAWRSDFRVISAAASYRDQRNNIISEFVEGEVNVRKLLLRYTDVPLVAHNIQFEKLVSKCRFPDIYPYMDWKIDTMRLAQVYDNGGREDEFRWVLDDKGDVIYDNEPAEEFDFLKYKREKLAGLGLVKCSQRILHHKESHKEKAHAWLRENLKVKKGKEGANLDKLPYELLKEYNEADTEVTLKLYEFITAYFKSINYDWVFDHTLYLNTVDLVVDAQITGVPIYRELLEKSILQLQQEIKEIEDVFKEKFKEEIKRIEETRIEDYIKKVKTEKSQAKRRTRILERDPKAIKAVQFNVGSNLQLRQLFIGALSISPKFYTIKGNPSFKSTVLGQWGLGGLMLQKRRKLLIIFQQCEALYNLSEPDGLWHLNLRVASTTTGRLSGGSH